MLHQIGEEHRITSYDQEASTSHRPSIRPPVSSTPTRMQPIRGRGRGRGRVDHPGRGRDGRQGHGRDGEGSSGTPKPTLPTSIPPHTYPSPEIFIPPHTDTSPSILSHTYTSPSIPPNTYTSLPYPMSLEPASIAIDITFSSHRLSSLTLPPIGDTILDLVSELGLLPARRPRAPHIRRVFHPSTPSAPSAPSAPRLYQLSRLLGSISSLGSSAPSAPSTPRLHQLRLRFHKTLLPNKLCILGVVLREI